MSLHVTLHLAKPLADSYADSVMSIKSYLSIQLLIFTFSTFRQRITHQILNSGPALGMFEVFDRTGPPFQTQKNPYKLRWHLS